MKRLLVVVAIFSGAVHAADFAERVALGNKAIATPQGKAYENSWAPAIQASLIECIPPGSTSTSDSGKFVLVATADRFGRLSAVAVQPSTRAAECFAQRFGAFQLPPPPTGTDYPVTVEMEVGSGFDS